MINIKNIQEYISSIASHSPYNPDLKKLENVDLNKLFYLLEKDFKRYYNSEYDLDKIKYFKGLLSTFFYRISRELYILQDENAALEYSSLGSFLTAIELYYSAEIGESFKINHGIGTIVGARSKIGKNVLLHHNVTLGEKNGRPTLEDNVIVFPGAVIVGNIVVGENSIIGANTFLDKSLPKNSIYK